MFRLNDAGIRSAFFEVLDARQPNWVDKLAFQTNSNHGLETYAMMGMPPAMREWKGGRQPAELGEDTLIIHNKPFESTVKVMKEELRRGQNEQILMRIQDLAKRGLQHKGNQLTDLIISGASLTCYDGQAFFSSTHSSRNSGTQDNDLTFAAATGTTPTIQEWRDAFLQSVKTIMSFKDDQGELVNEGARSFVPMVPSSMFEVAQQALKLPQIDNGMSNILVNLNEYQFEDPVVNFRLTDSASFFTFRTDGSMKPLIIQEEVPLDMPSVAEGSEEEFFNRNHLYSAEWWGGFAYGEWRYAVRTVFT